LAEDYPNPTPPTLYPPPANSFGGNVDTDIRFIAPPGQTGLPKPFSTGNVALNASQVPVTPHRHATLANVVNDTPTAPTAFTAVVRESDDGGDGSTWAYEMAGTANAEEPTVGMTSEAPPAQLADPHSHAFTIESDPNNPTGSNLPPYWAVLYIIKD
jgi:hypothetical protein